MILLSQVVMGGAAGWGFAQTAIAIIIILAVIGIVIIAARVMGVPIPQWVWQIIGIIVVAFVAIWAIRFLLGM